MKMTAYLAFLSLLLLGGCLLKPYVPVPDAAYSVESRWAIIQSDSLTLYLRPQTYAGEAQAASSSFFPLYLRARNNTTRAISLDRNSFSLIAGTQQYDYVPLNLVLGSINNFHQPSQFEDPFAPGYQQTQDQYLQEAQQQYLELLNNYFSFGDLLPGGSKEGYLFYNERVRQADSFLLDALGTRVEFSRK